MPDTDTGKTNANAGADESRLIAEAQAAVLEQTEKNEFDAAPYERATELLESLPPAKYVDERVRLALDITAATRSDYRLDLSRRALYAAFSLIANLRTSVSHVNGSPLPLPSRQHQEMLNDP